MADFNKLFFGMDFIFKLFVLVEHVQDLSSDTGRWLHFGIFLQVQSHDIELIGRVSPPDKIGDIFILVRLTGMPNHFVITLLIVSLEPRKKLLHVVCRLLFLLLLGDIQDTVFRYRQKLFFHVFRFGPVEVTTLR